MDNWIRWIKCFVWLGRGWLSGFTWILMFIADLWMIKAIDES